MSEANVFILINLGCEMLYVIDQRLTAQSIALDKSIQVMRDVTCVLLDPKFLEQLILGNQEQKSLITTQHCKMLLNEIACCSLMKLDDFSMTKLWDLMTMLYKWQLFVSKYPQHILDITFRHLDGIGRLYPDVKKAMLVDYTKNNLLDFWNSYDETAQLNIYQTIRNWLDCFNVKISILIRLGFQNSDGLLLKNVVLDYIENFIETTGDNIYIKSAQIFQSDNNPNENNKNVISKFDNFINQLNVGIVVPEHKEIVKETNMLFDFSLNIVNNDDTKQVNTNQLPLGDENNDEFIQIKTARNTATNSSWESIIGGSTNHQSKSNTGQDLKSLLNSKLT